MTIIILLSVIIIAGILVVVRHQYLLSERAQLMQEALRNHDFTFRLPTKGLFYGERQLQEAFNNTSQEVARLMAQNEVEAWQRLTRVLTHEIMNGVAPIASISQSYLALPQTKDSVYEEGLRAIDDTSRGLQTFVENYRKLTQLQKATPAEISLREACEAIRNMYADTRFAIAVGPDITVKTDPALLRQVLVNIVKNAIEAGATRIDMRYDNDLKISNNGQPIAAEVWRDIFVPFFTTKSSGSGIGLSLSRQLMTMQGHDLSIAERPVAGYSVTFVIAF